jgi:hydroxyacylglutathione hydrolase
VKVNFRRCGTRGFTSLCGVNIRVIPAGPIQTNAYLLTEPSLKAAVLVDAPQGVWGPVKDALQADGCALSELWLTHAHWDHTQGVAEVVAATGAPVSAHPDDRVLLETPEVMRPLMMDDEELTPVRVSRWLADNDTIDALGRKVLVRHVPGHCPGSLMFYFESDGFAITGDALFRRAVGRTDLPMGDFAALEKAIQEKIYVLADAVTVFPGHGGPTTVGEEKRENPFVRARG